MSGQTTAADRLERILYILPAAHRRGGVALTELAQALGVDVDCIMQDIEAVTAREYYHPAGSTDSMCIRIDGDRVVLDASGEFDRPVRLNQREALAVHLGLQIIAAESDEQRRARILALAARIADELVVPATATVHEQRASLAMPQLHAELVPGAVEEDVEYHPEEEQALLLGVGRDAIRGELSDAIMEQRAVRLTYLKAGAHAAEIRQLVPQQLVYADGNWYVLGYDLERCAPRIFRLDRMLAVSVGEVVADEIARDREWISVIAERGTAPYHAEADTEVVVRYAPGIARWVAERASVEAEPDGSVRVRYSVADPRWIVRHVLQFAGAAWIEEPAALRRLVAQRALELGACAHASSAV